MVLFTILLLMVLILTLITAFTIAIGGSVFVVIFGDVIVCVFILIWVMKKLFRKK